MNAMASGEETKAKAEADTGKTVVSNTKESDDYDCLQTDLDSTGKKVDQGGSSVVRRLFKAIIILVSVVVVLYLFACSIDLMGNGLKLVMVSTADSIFNSELFRNPIAGVMVGVMATIILQSSSTSTAIIVTLVSSKSLSVAQAIPMVMGANVGTSVTNTFVAMGQINVKEEFERAFAGATVHDMFNWLTVIVLLPLELCTGYLFTLSHFLLQSLLSSSPDDRVAIPGLNTVTRPLTNCIVMVSTEIVKETKEGNHPIGNATTPRHQSLMRQNCGDGDTFEPCRSLFNLLEWSDQVTGVVVVILSLISLCSCLLALVKLLRYAFSDYVTKVIAKTVNSKLPQPFTFLTGYLCALIGAALTLIIQSSSIFTSTLTPLVGLGVLELETIYPMTLGSNLGTTGTGLLTAFATSGEMKVAALQIALCHLLFNASGFIIWYPIPTLRKIPISMAKFLGRVTSNYRWFAVVYIVIMFVVAPIIVFCLSWSSKIVLYIVVVTLTTFLLVILAISYIQSSKLLLPFLPTFLTTWNFLPSFLRSLEPYDKVIESCRGKSTRSCVFCGETEQPQCAVEMTEIDSVTQR